MVLQTILLSFVFQFQDARNAFTSSDPFYIFDHFDTFYSLIENAGSCQMITLYRGCDLVYLTADKLGNLLATYLQSNNVADRNSHLNLTKMVLFLSVGLVNCMDNVTGDEGGSKKGNQKNRQSDTNTAERDERRYKTLVQIYNVMQLPLEKLWAESIAEEAFVK